MIRQISFSILILFFLIQNVSCNPHTPADTLVSEIWELDKLENIGGHETTVIGNPQVVASELGNAISFDGDGDMLLINANPLGNAKEFTVELIFKPAACYPLNTDPRYVHIQDLNDPAAKRVMMEIRVNSRNQWYLDGFMNTDKSNLTLIDSNKVHPTDGWMHAAITYKDNIFKTYVNGVEELTGTVSYTSEIVALTAQTSLGARMNQRNWYNGLMKRFKVTQKALSPAEFLTIATTGNSPVISETSGIVVFPGVADDYIRVTCNKIKSEMNFRILNLYGQVVSKEFSVLPDSEEIRLNTANLVSGIYFLVIQSGNFIETKRFVIKH